MNAKTYFSTVQHTKGQVTRRYGTVVLTVVLAFSLFAHEVSRAVSPARADSPSVTSLYDLVQAGMGDVAVQQVSTYAQQLGGWMPAPGDELAFDPYLSRKVRGVSLDYDEPPDCNNPQVSMDPESCFAQFREMERRVRFGHSMFTSPAEDGTTEVRPAFDDLLSTYVEEVGHSWQEYLYETNGAGSGTRVRQTSMAESERWAAGREYQVKRYLLSLDGTLLHLSDRQRSTLTAQVCGDYANPLGHEVPPYGVPAGWPNAEGWPTTNPTPDELSAFCTGS